MMPRTWAEWFWVAFWLAALVLAMVLAKGLLSEPRRTRI